jgi:ATP-dependent Clp protease adaptor protein ClpS
MAGPKEIDPDKPDPKETDLVTEGGTQTLVRPLPKTKAPSFYKVLILNDDFTPRDFVVHVLQKFFRKNETEAVQLMLQVHHQGMGIAGVYTFEVAETKAYQVNLYSKQNNFPLKCTVEQA